MPVALIADRGIRTSTSAGTAVVSLTTGASILAAPNTYLIARVGVDNSGASGAAPGLAVTDSAGNTWTVGAPALNDPGAASAGIAAYLCYCKVVNAYTNASTVTFTWTTGSPLSAIVIEEWRGIDSVTPVWTAQVVANSASASFSVAITPTNGSALLYAMSAIQGVSADWGALDSDGLLALWTGLTKDQANTGTPATSVSVYGGYKVLPTTGTFAQTWNHTLGTARSSGSVIIMFHSGAVEATPPKVTTVTAVPAPTLASSQTVTPTAVATVTAVPAPTLSSSRTATPAAVATVTAIPGPTLRVDVAVTPAAVATVVAIPAPTIVITGGNSTVTPAAVATVASIPAPTLKADTAVTPTAVPTVVAVPAPTLKATSVATPAVVPTVVAVPAPTLIATFGVSPSVVPTLVAVPAPTLKADTKITPAVVTTVTTVPAPTPLVTGDSNAQPVPVVTVVAVPAPTPIATSKATPASVDTFTTIPAPTLVSALPAPELEEPLTVQTSSTKLVVDPQSTKWTPNPQSTRYRTDPSSTEWESDL